MTIRSHVGTKTTNSISNFMGYLDLFYFNPDGIANILLVWNVKNSIVLHSTLKVVTPSPSTRNTEISCSKSARKGYFFHDNALHNGTTLTIADQKKELYTKRHFLAADIA